MFVGTQHTYRKHKHGNSLLDINVNPINETRKAPHFLRTQNKMLPWSFLKLKKQKSEMQIKIITIQHPRGLWYTIYIYMSNHNLDFLFRGTDLETDYKVRHCTWSPELAANNTKALVRD